MLKTNSISLAVHMAILVTFFVFTSYISYLARVFAVLEESYTPYIIYAVLSVIAYFFTGFFIGSIFRIRSKGIKNAASVCVVAAIGLIIWIITILSIHFSGAVSDGFEWLFFYLFYMPFVSLANLMPAGAVPQYLFICICAIPTLLMWAGIEYKASLYRHIAKVKKV